MSLQGQADTVFLALCLWREARGEAREAKIAVAHSVLNRISSPSWGNTIPAVIFQRLQYSSLTHDRDPQLTNWPQPSDASWQECLAVADMVISGQIPSPIEDADSYHDISISPPNWTANFVKQIGRLKFYKVGR
jgi:N-acetylmuramoyl-L-alanine amidase